MWINIIKGEKSKIWDSPLYLQIKMLFGTDEAAIYA